MEYKNVGDENLPPSTTHTVKLYYTSDKDWKINNSPLTLIDEKIKNELISKDQSLNETFTWDTSGLTPGTYYLVTEAYSNGSRTSDCPQSGNDWEYSDSNNKQTSQIKLYSSGVDLSMNTALIAPHNPMENDQIHTSVHLENTGNIPANNVDIKYTVYDQSSVIVYQTTKTIDLSASTCSTPAEATIVTNFSLPKEGVYKTKLEIDPLDSIIEIDETNNIVEDFIYVTEENFSFNITGTTGVNVLNSSGAYHAAEADDENINIWAQASSHDNCESIICFSMGLGSCEQYKCRKR